jgi:hypothetical protein
MQQNVLMQDVVSCISLRGKYIGLAGPENISDAGRHEIFGSRQPLV